MRGMASHPSIDFGYPWWLTYGHLIVLVPALVALLAGIVRRWPLVVKVGLALVAGWAALALVVVWSLHVNGVPALPTESFLRSGVGRVLDIGAGTGRSSVMVLVARPNATLVAVDLFGESFERHFGSRGGPRERLLANLRAAGVDGRASIETADMRKLPFDAPTFDAVVSAYAHGTRRPAGRPRKPLAETRFACFKPGRPIFLAGGLNPETNPL